MFECIFLLVIDSSTISIASHNCVNPSIDENQLQSVPAEVGNLSNLQTLDFCKLNQSPFHLFLIADGWSVSIMLPYLVHLIMMFVHFTATNLLQSVPTEIGDLLNLQKLSLCESSKSVFPLYLLAYFCLSLKVPPYLLHLTMMFVHFTASNLLTSVPTEIGELVNLQKLSLCKWSQSVFPLYLIAYFCSSLFMLPYLLHLTMLFVHFFLQITMSFNQCHLRLAICQI